MTSLTYLTIASAQLLGQIAAQPGLMSGPKLIRAGLWVEDHLTDLPMPPIQPGRDGQPCDWRDYEQAAKAWGRTMLPPIEISEKDRDAIKALLEAAQGKQMLAASPAAARLLVAFGLGPED
jgi:hypothetical protein